MVTINHLSGDEEKVILYLQVWTMSLPEGNETDSAKKELLKSIWKHFQVATAPHNHNTGCTAPSWTKKNYLFNRLCNLKSKNCFRKLIKEDFL